MDNSPTTQHDNAYAINGQRFSAPVLGPGLYVAATPIGNLKDITLRVVETLAACDLIACEDTRVTAKLLRHYGIQTRTMSYNEHNADHAGNRILEKIVGGKSVALVSDAGTPLLSDPGARLVRDTALHDVKVTPLPGASAPLAALVASGLPMTDWRFVGFLPGKSAARQKLLQGISRSAESTVFFESPNRVLATLQDMKTVFGPDRMVCIARELTKLHEDIITGPIGELAENFPKEKCRGEFVIITGPAEATATINPDDVLRELLLAHPVSRAAAQAAELTGLPKRELYQRALELKDGKGE